MKKLILLFILCLISSPSHASERREKIGEALGNPIYRDQIKDNKYLYWQLHKLFRAPFEKKFEEIHKKELKVEDWEIKYVKAFYMEKYEQKMKVEKRKLEIKLEYFEKQLKKENLQESERKEIESKKRYTLMELKPPDNINYKYILSHWKFHRLLYDKFEGGRVIWEQEGFVAFDAMLRWLKFHEKKGDFKIYDSDFYKEFYSYWTKNEKDSPFFLEKTDMNEFIHPEWEPIIKIED